MPKISPLKRARRQLPPPIDGAAPVRQVAGKAHAEERQARHERLGNHKFRRKIIQCKLPTSAYRALFNGKECASTPFSFHCLMMALTKVLPMICCCRGVVPLQRQCISIELRLRVVPSAGS